METRGSRLLTVRQFCAEYPWPSESALRAIISDAAGGKNKFQGVFTRIGRRVLVDEKLFWTVVTDQQNTTGLPYPKAIA